MLDDVKSDADERMSKSLVALDAAFARIRTGRAHPKLLDGINVDYYGTPTPLNQVANITVEDARTLAVSPWEKRSSSTSKASSTSTIRRIVYTKSRQLDAQT